MNMKILSPAGDIESLKLAVYNGADEIYLGVKDFNARNIEGFNLASLKQAVNFAHIYGVRVFLAVNILFGDDEIQSALDLVVDAFNVGVDAFIVQDIGLIALLRKYYPQIEIHASTQMGIHNLEGVKFVEELGVKRVVLARETALEEIKRIKQNSNVEIEYFAHGALCVCFSGNCYLSSYLLEASGNRGKCKQLCRLPYEFSFNNKKLANGYLLSAKDFNMLNRLQDLLNAGVDSLKIEGRARRPYYVGEITKAYRNALNGLDVNTQNVRLAFNRGFTEGYFNGNGNIISNKQNHIGLEIGKIEKVKTGNKFNEIYLSSNYPITAKSTLKFFKDDQEVATISAFDIVKQGRLYKVTTTQQIPIGAKVNLIADYEKEQTMLKDIRKRKLNMHISALINKEILAEVEINGKWYKIKGEILTEAKNRPLTEQEILENFNKSEYFTPNITFNLENVFMLKQQLNSFRREVYSFVENVLTNVENQIGKVQIRKEQPVKEFDNYSFIEDLSEDFKNENIMYSPESYSLDKIKNFISKCKELNKVPYLDLPNFATEKDIKLLKDIVEKTKIAIVVNNLYALNFNTKKILGGGMNIYNSYTAKYFNLPYIKAEKGEFKMPYMTMRHCPMKSLLKADCAKCPYKSGYIYTMQNGKKLKLKRKKLTECTFYLTD